MEVKRLFGVLLLCLAISACAGKVVPSFNSTPDYSQLYLRGVFTWWEADEKYKVSEIRNGVYASQVDLIADGQPYDFRFADVNWTPELNCGYLNAAQDRLVYVNKPVKASCTSNNENFKFTPTETGTFQFSIDFSGFGSPEVLVKLVKK